jgi:O-acetyl-ADP-ribose deacetylase (regulator of RNase III)
MDDIEAGLVDLVTQVGALGIRSIAIPPLGAGNGGLDWAEVRPRIIDAFAPLPDLEVLLWEPGAAPPVEERPVNTERPHLTPVRAAVLGLMGRYSVLDYGLSQLEVQKLAYFLQVAGEDLRLDYKAATYGPYAERLYHMLMHLEGHQIVGLEDRSPGAALRLEPRAVDEAESFLASHPGTKARFERVAELIDGFETPYGMELLSSVHWVARHDGRARDSANAALAALHGWSPRKRATFKAHHVNVAWQRLRDNGWLEQTPQA